MSRDRVEEFFEKNCKSWKTTSFIQIYRAVNNGQDSVIPMARVRVRIAELLEEGKIRRFPVYKWNRRFWRYRYSG